MVFRVNAASGRGKLHKKGEDIGARAATVKLEKKEKTGRGPTGRSRKGVRVCLEITIHVQNGRGAPHGRAEKERLRLGRRGGGDRGGPAHETLPPILTSRRTIGSYQLVKLEIKENTHCDVSNEQHPEECRRPLTY